MYGFGMKSYNHIKNSGHSTKLDYAAWLWIGFYVLICAIRWNVGADCNTYIYGFENGYIDEVRSHEFVWAGLVFLIYRLGFPSSIGMGIAAFMQIFFIAKAVKDYRYLLITIPIVLFGGNYFLELQNGVRQMIVSCIFLYTSRWIVDKRPVPYIIFLYVASFIHHSALALIPLYILCFIPFAKKGLADRRILCLILFVCCFVLGITPQFGGMARYVGLFAQQFGYVEYEDYLVNIITNQAEQSARNFGPTQFSFFLTALSLIWFGPKLSRDFRLKIKYFDLWYLLGFCYGCLYFLFCNVGYMFLRPIMHLELFQMLIISLLLYDFYIQKRKIFQKVLYIILVVILWVNISWGILKNMSDPYETITYKTIITKGELI